MKQTIHHAIIYGTPLKKSIGKNSFVRQYHLLRAWIYSQAVPKLAVDNNAFDVLCKQLAAALAIVLVLSGVAAFFSPLHYLIEIALFSVAAALFISREQAQHHLAREKKKCSVGARIISASLKRAKRSQRQRQRVTISNSGSVPLAGA